ncbi:hypothetical protein SETIT_1G270900v2 [Setaria italica]|uniref:Uncharacterized protein n=2 Tax=Setaria TaxID=4554 RepID=A0A368PQ24_SETIT|nr:hypothetical protein SETIT_1G270900v2 [Setaria italica]TKW40880.1 hypothetical protein SEVIR_1G275600v2 [Setaria viridis]
MSVSTCAGVRPPCLHLEPPAPLQSLLSSWPQETKPLLQMGKANTSEWLFQKLDHKESKLKNKANF